MEGIRGIEKGVCVNTRVGKTKTRATHTWLTHDMRACACTVSFENRSHGLAYLLNAQSSTSWTV